MTKRITIVGGGPAGLMAAEVASAAGLTVDVFEAKGSVGRKFLIAGKGGLNLTHSEHRAEFVGRYGARSDEVSRWLSEFDADAIRAWAHGLGVETFVGTSGRVFPKDMKAAPLLRSWVRRLRDQGVRFHVNHYCVDLSDDRTLKFKTAEGIRTIHADAIVLALGGASWPQLGSDGAWVKWVSERGVDITPLEPANCGFDVEWTAIFANRFAGQPVKSVVITSGSRRLQGEFVITASGVEGSAIYAMSSQLRQSIADQGIAEITLDLAPQSDATQLKVKLSKPRKGRSLTEHLRRTVGIDGVKAGLLYEVIGKDAMNDIHVLTAAIKALPLKLVRARPIAEAISTAGGVSFDALDERLMLRSLPGVFCAGEMLDWEAPTGGYLLTACLASGRIAAKGVMRWVQGA